MELLIDTFQLFCFIFIFANGCIGFEERVNFPRLSPPALFVFGDSHSDTGNYMAAFPFIADAENSPYHSTYFHGPSGRFSNGRLIIDFIASKWGLPFVQPYFHDSVPNYRHGINFAVAASTARNVTDGIPFYLPVQTDQFVRFKRKVSASLISKPGPDCLVSQIPSSKAFKDGIYVIFTGSNDVSNRSPRFVKEKIAPQVVLAISKAVKDLHKEGAKNFMVFTIPAIGCSAYVRIVLASGGRFNSTDALGCLKDYNDVVEFSNHELQKALANLTPQLKDVNIMIADIYSFMLEAFANPSSYGFDEKVKFKACCGYGGDPYNFNPEIRCGRSPAKACSNPDKYISWDGGHFTEAFNHKFVEEMMKGMPYLKPASLFHY